VPNSVIDRVHHVCRPALTGRAARRLGQCAACVEHRSRTTARRQRSASRFHNSGSTACRWPTTGGFCHAASARAASGSPSSVRHSADRCCVVAIIQSSAGTAAPAASPGAAEGDGAARPGYLFAPLVGPPYAGRSSFGSLVPLTTCHGVDDPCSACCRLCISNQRCPIL